MVSSQSPKAVTIDATQHTYHRRPDLIRLFNVIEYFRRGILESICRWSSGYEAAQVLGLVTTSNRPLPSRSAGVAPTIMMHRG
jgi:hypothetical protein